MKFTATILALASAAFVSAQTKLTQAQAEAQLAEAGIEAYSDGGCTDPAGGLSCTSYQGINQDTVTAAITLKTACGGCEVLITGGTESGHATSTYSHANGYKLDLSLDTTLDAYITGAFTRIADRSDGYAQYEAGSGNVYCLEGNHWDITFYNCGC